MCLLCLLHSLIQCKSTVLHTVLGAGDTVVRNGLISSLSTWDSQSSGEGDKQSSLPFGTLVRLGDKPKMTWQRERRNWRSG